MKSIHWLKANILSETWPKQRATERHRGALGAKAKNAEWRYERDMRMSVSGRLSGCRDESILARSRTMRATSKSNPSDQRQRANINGNLQKKTSTLFVMSLMRSTRVTKRLMPQNDNISKHMQQPRIDSEANRWPFSELNQVKLWTHQNHCYGN